MDSTGALAAAGSEAYLAEEWPAAIRWAAEADKEGVEWIIPMPEPLRATLQAYTGDRGLVGNALLFPSRRDSSKPLPKETACYWRRRAEKEAGLKHQKRGGWLDPSALQRAYQHADAETARAVREVGAD